MATADGRVALVDVTETLTVSTVSEPKGHLFTDVVWDGPDALIVAEGDSGRVSRWRADDGLAETHAWDAHAYAPGCPAEVWCVGRDRRTGLYVSGADDGLLKGGWDAPVAKTGARPAPRRRRHGGVVRRRRRRDGLVRRVRALVGPARAAGRCRRRPLRWAAARARAARDSDGYLAACMGAGACAGRAAPFTVAGRLRPPPAPSPTGRRPQGVAADRVVLVL